MNALMMAASALKLVRPDPLATRQPTSTLKDCKGSQLVDRIIDSSLEATDKATSEAIVIPPLLAQTEGEASMATLPSTSDSDYTSSSIASVGIGNLSLLQAKDLSEAEREALLDSLPCYTLEEVSRHCEVEDGWIVFYDRVYDISKFLHEVSAKCA